MKVFISQSPNVNSQASTFELLEVIFLNLLSCGNQPNPMIPFFRKIRKKIVAGIPAESGANKPIKPAWLVGRYMRYAIGEIVLVVVGILIALSINNWNEKLKNNKLKEFYMKSLVEDLTRDTLDINRVASLQEKEIYLLQSFTDRIYQQSSSKSTLY